MLASHGFSAIATTSAGIAFSLGVADYAGAVAQKEMLGAVQRIARSVDLPVSADLEAGYGTEPEHVARTIKLAIAAMLKRNLTIPLRGLYGQIVYTRIVDANIRHHRRSRNYADGSGRHGRQ